MEDPGGAERVEGTATGPEVCVGAKEMTDQGRDIRTRDPGDARGITGHSEEPEWSQWVKGTWLSHGLGGPTWNGRVQEVSLPKTMVELAGQKIVATPVEPEKQKDMDEQGNWVEPVKKAEPRNCVEPVKGAKPGNWTGLVKEARGELLARCLRELGSRARKRESASGLCHSAGFRLSRLH
ncbi:hypothetical protein DPX16_20111 [Anabarilius grahami]|uniref:Uncharacterized protein n=1 Tax=Anabarilius grahami TaxID=495550 RepID=A0A3N0XQQ1_ANAGA|nr:hypothetical protein DPX16_20111 [Anabarilius grahami]